MKPICVPCHRFFRMKKQGFYFTESMPTVNQAKPGLDEVEKWTPYKIWAGDLWGCEGCGAEILSGFGREPVAEHYQERFKTVRHSLAADQFSVNDC
jgi:hypothetical protein